MPNFTRRTFLVVAVSATTVPLAARRRGSTACNPLARIHSDLRPAAERMTKAAQSAGPLSSSTLAIMRAGDAAAAQAIRNDVSVTERKISYGPVQPSITVYVINAKPGINRPTVFHIHGGGFVGGSAKSVQRPLQELARALDCVIVSVEYRLAPETDWRGSTADNYNALMWLYANATEIGVDRARIVVFGESAGGGHAALLAIKARDGNVVRLAGQVLVYPMLDDRTRVAPTCSNFYSWTPASNRFGWRAFLGQESGTLLVPTAAVPSRTDDLSGLPPTWIGVGSIDLFAKENVTFARRLRQAGVPTELLITSGGFHGFDVLVPEATVSRKFTAQKINALRRFLRAV